MYIRKKPTKSCQVRWIDIVFFRGRPGCRSASWVVCAGGELTPCSQGFGLDGGNKWNLPGTWKKMELWKRMGSTRYLEENGIYQVYGRDWGFQEKVRMDASSRGLSAVWEKMGSTRCMEENGNYQVSGRNWCSQSFVRGEELTPCSQGFGLGSGSIKGWSLGMEFGCSEPEERSAVRGRKGMACHWIEPLWKQLI